MSSLQVHSTINGLTSSSKFLIAALCIVPALVHANAPLTVDGYLVEVQTKSPSYLAYKSSYEAADLSQKDAELQLQLLPTAFSSASVSSEAKPSPFFAYEKLDTTSVTMGIAQQYKNGLQAKVGYLYEDTLYAGVKPRYYDGRLQGEVTLPLLRNFWGRETTAQLQALKSANELKRASGRAGQDGALLEAKVAYWKLAVAREAAKVSYDALKRAEAMFEWAQRRVKLSLADASESLQATAQLKARRIELKQAQEEVRSSSRTFNLLRGINKDDVSEELVSLAESEKQKFTIPQKAHRADTEAALAANSAGEAKAQAAIESTRTQLDLYAMYALNSPLSSNTSDAIADSLKTTKPSNAVGLKLTMPLDFSATHDSQTGWRKEAEAQKLLATKKILDEERDWQDLLSRHSSVIEQVGLLTDLEKAQLEKLENEKKRQQSGRTTMAQVILFENDYEQTQLLRLKSLAELMLLRAQLTLFSKN